MIRFGRVAVVAVMLTGCSVDADRSVMQPVPLIELRLAGSESTESAIQTRFNGEDLYLHPEAIVSDDDFETVVPEVTPEGIQLRYQLGASGARRLRQETSSNIGERIALISRGRVVAAPTVRSEVGGQGLMAVELPRIEAEELARAIQERWPR